MYKYKLTDSSISAKTQFMQLDGNVSNLSNTFSVSDNDSRKVLNMIQKMKHSQNPSQLIFIRTLGKMRKLDSQ